MKTVKIIAEIHIDVPDEIEECSASEVADWFKDALITTQPDTVEYTSEDPLFGSIVNIVSFETIKIPQQRD